MIPCSSLLKFMKHRQLFMVWLMLVCSVYTSLPAQPMEEVNKFAYKGQPEDLNDSVITVNEKMVAMSEYIYVGTPTTAVTKPVPSSIFFIIDHSSRMYTDTDKDIWGNRFRIIHDLIDSLRSKLPESEVGISIFTQYLYFRPDDEPRLIKCPGIDSGAFFPLMRFDSSYAPDGKLGCQVLQDFIKTETVTENIQGGTYTFVDLKYRPNPIWDDWQDGSNTNINAGFEAAKHAFQSAKHPKNQQFIIFISGDERHPQTLPNDYVLGVGLPTTFTVYFVGPGEQPPQELVDMNTNIQNNGYSLNNPKSQLWPFSNTSYDTLMQFLMDNVVETIVLSQTSYPTEITVNGITNPNPWDSTGFDFTKPFPLTGVYTSFNYDIDYKIWAVDSITPDGDTIWAYKDTSTHTEFDVVIQSGAPDLPDTFDVRPWERELGFYYNNTQVTVINEAMTPLELRFSYNDSDANYNYNNAQIEVVTTEGLAQDKEYYSLSKSGNTFSGTFPRVAINDNQIPTQGNGTIEHYMPDTLVSIFRNNEDPKLPLDTMRAAGICLLSGSVNIEAGYYFDNNADGFVDSIYVDASTDIAGGLTDAHVVEIIERALTLPSFRNFTVNVSGVVSGGFYIDVTEDISNPTTYVTNDDVIEAGSVILSMGGWVVATTATIHDKVAPIIHWNDKSAFLTDYQVDTIADTLGVKFSEPIENVTHEQPFYFLDISPNPDTNYTVRLVNVGQPKPDSMVFYVRSIGVMYMEDGDSIWLHETNRVSDVAGNYQNNSNNIRRRLWVRRIYTQYELIPNADSPIDLSKIDSNDYVIPDNIIDILFNQGIIDDLDLSMNSNGEYVGMLISVAPKDINYVLPDFTLLGRIDISDEDGNEVVPESKMAWYEQNKSLVWVWNCKNHNGQYVYTGKYTCSAEIKEITPSLYPSGNGPIQIKRFTVEILGDYKSDDSCGGCGTSSELAFIPPIGFKLASIAKKRKKWWYRMFKRLKAIVTCS